MSDRRHLPFRRLMRIMRSESEDAPGVFADKRCVFGKTLDVQTEREENIVDFQRVDGGRNARAGIRQGPRGQLAFSRDRAETERLDPVRRVADEMNLFSSAGKGPSREGLNEVGA